MGKSTKKSKVDAAPAVTLPVVSSGKGKRGAEQVKEKVSAKKLKKNDGTAQAIEKLKSETKTEKKTIKKKEISSSEDESSESEEEEKVPSVKAVKPSTKKPVVASTNGSAKKNKSSSKKVKSSSDSDSDSSDESDSEKDAKSKNKVIAPSAKKVESSSDSDSDSSSGSDEDAPQPIQVKKVASKPDTSSDSSSDSDEEAPQPIQGKTVASKPDTSSDSSSEEENDKITTAVNKSSASAKKTDDSSSDEDEDSSEDSSEDDEKSKATKVPITGSKNVPVISKDTESSDSSDNSESDKDKATVTPKKDDSSDSSSDSDSEDDVAPAKKPASATGKNSKQSDQVVKKGSSSEDSSEDEDGSDDEDKKPSKGQQKNGTDVEMVDAVTPKAVKKAPETPVTPQVQSGGSKTLFVGNLPFSVEQNDVKNFFKDAGKVTEVRFSLDRDGNFKGFGHVEFATAEAAQKGLALKGKQLMNRELNIDLARERGSYTPGNERTPFQKGRTAQGTSLFVAGIDRNSGEDEVRSVLQEHFGACGELTRVSIPPDRDSGGLKGFAYIDFTDSGSLNKALELGGPEFGGYTLRVEEAKPRDNSGPNNRGNFQRGRDSNRGRHSNRGRGDRSFDRSGGDRSNSGRGRFNKPSMAAPGTGKKTTFDD